jgi:hypothetical protein
MGANKKRHQTFGKRNRERAVEEKRTLKRQAKQAKREAARNGEPWPLEPTPLEPTPATPETELAAIRDGVEPTPATPPADLE